MLKITELGILADDLTGACDVAACFARATGPVTVLLSPDTPGGDAPGLSVINTQARLQPGARSRELNHHTGRRLAGRPVLFMKIDTALRGPVGAGIEGLLAGAGPRRVIVAPALPRIGKTTRGGVQYDAGVPIDRTAYARDPATPVESAVIAEILARTGRVECEVRDAETDADLERIVAEALDGAPSLFVGSLGLADALAARLERQADRKAPATRATRPLIVCGSQYERAHQQLEQAAACCGGEVVWLDPTQVGAPEPQWPARQASGPAPLLLGMVRRRIDPARWSASEVVARFTAQVAALIQRLQPDGLGVIGGETAWHLLSRLGVGRLSIHGRMGEVTSYGRVLDGQFAGRPYVSKGGSVGEDDAVIRMVDYLGNAE